MSTLTITPTSEISIQQLIHSPKLPFYVREFRSLLEEEQKKRERFYREMREDQKVEFINGKVIMQSPVKLRHSDVSERLFILLSTYVKKHKLGKVGHEKLLITLTRNDYEPDICFFRADRAAAFRPDQMKFPAPDFVVEVLSPSTEAVDREIKFDDYAAHGVAEYWIIDPDRETVEQYILKGSGGRATYELSVKVKAGNIESAAVEGFDIPVRAIFDDRQQLAALARVLEA